MANFKQLHSIVELIPEHLLTPLGILNREKVAQNPKLVVLAGMGGSGIVGDVVKSIFPKLPLLIHKGYGLPEFSQEAVLVIAVSYSGSTEETLSAYRKARELKLPIAVVSGGGELEALAKNDEVPYVHIDHKGSVPNRFRVGHLTRGVLEILSATGLLGNLKEICEPLATHPLSVDAELVNRLSNLFANKTVLVYASSQLQGLAYLWKEALNETAKRPAFTYNVLDVAHNEIESIGALKDSAILLLVDPQEPPELQKRFAELISLAAEKSWPHEALVLEHPSRIIDAAKSAKAALLVALDIAKKNGVDPVETPLINELKKRRANN